MGEERPEEKDELMLRQAHVACVFTARPVWRSFSAMARDYRRWLGQLLMLRYGPRRVIELGPAAEGEPFSLNEQQSASPNTCHAGRSEGSASSVPFPQADSSSLPSSE